MEMAYKNMKRNKSANKNKRRIMKDAVIDFTAFLDFWKNK